MSRSFCAATRRRLAVLLVFVVCVLFIPADAAAYQVDHKTFLYFDVTGTQSLAYDFRSIHRLEILQYSAVEALYPVFYSGSIYKNRPLLGIKALCNRFGLIRNFLFQCTNRVIASCPQAEGHWYANSEAEVLFSVLPKRDGPVVANCLVPETLACESCPECEVCPGSPILLDLDGDGFHLSGLSDSVLFDIDGEGTAEELGWTRASERDGFLALDRNGNGFIDNGRELFGNHTLLRGGSESLHGYEALAEFDREEGGGNEDGFIDSDDLVFEDLRIWLDLNHDGVSQAGELSALHAMGVERLDLGIVESRRRDRYGNLFLYKSKAWVKGVGRSEVPVQTSDVFFVVAE